LNLTTDRHEASRGLFARAELLILSRLDRGIQSATELLPLKPEGGVGVVHSFNCTPAFVDMRLADALVLSNLLTLVN